MKGIVVKVFNDVGIEWESIKYPVVPDDREWCKEHIGAEVEFEFQNIRYYPHAFLVTRKAPAWPPVDTLTHGNHLIYVSVPKKREDLPKPEIDRIERAVYSAFSTAYNMGAAGVIEIDAHITWWNNNKSFLYATN